MPLENVSTSVEGNKIAEGVLGAWYQAPRDNLQASTSNDHYASLQGNWNLSDNRVLSILNHRLAQLVLCVRTPRANRSLDP